MIATLIELVHARLDLVGVELQLEVQRATSVVLWAFAGIVLGIVALVMLAVTVLIALWETHRVLAAVGLTASFAIASLGVALSVRRRVRAWPRMFHSTLDELKHDAATLRGREP
jgi:uncharacterized membrane protein YqjE